VTTFVLVHGGWHGGWCWRKVTPLLRAAGHEVYTPTLTGLGERAHLAGPAVDLGCHVRDRRAVLEAEDLHDVVLVGHSSSGPVITGVAADPDTAARLRRLVYLDAFVPAAGQSVLDLVPDARRETFEGLAREHGDGWRIPLDRDAALSSWCITEPADLAWMRPRLVPQPLATLRQPLERDPVPGIPGSYLHCVRGPMAATFGRFADEAAAAPARWTVRQLDTGHDAMVTLPRELVELLLAEL